MSGFVRVKVLPNQPHTALEKSNWIGKTLDVPLKELLDLRNQTIREVIYYLIKF
jgi:hypothetical protein